MIITFLQTMSAYWPEDEEPKQQYGPFDVSFVSSETVNGIHMKEFNIALVKKVVFRK